MVFLGIVLAGAAVALGAGIFAENSAPASLNIFGQHLPGVTSQGQVFVIGVIVTAIFAAGLTISSMGMGRSMRVRRELRDREESLVALETEKQQVERELARVRAVPATGDVRVASQARSRDPMSPFFDNPA